MTEYILIFPGFARDPGWCHVVVSAEDHVAAVLVGDLADNPGTSVINATEQIAEAISQHLLDGATASEFTMFEYEPKGLPELTPTFYRINWKGEQGRFSMPTWTIVDPGKDPRLDSIRGRVRADNYTFDALTAERKLPLIDASASEEVVARARARTVGPEEFRQAMTPTIQVLRIFAAAVDDIGSRQPNVDSQAIREIEAERELRTRSAWENPISDTHTFGAVTLRAATDNLRTFAEAFDARLPPVYGHLAVARAALETSVITAWLNEPGIAYLERVKRGMCERLYSANEVKRLGIEPDAAQTLEQYLADAISFGWQAEFDPDGKPSVDGTGWPSIPDGITRLLTGDDGNPGPLLWSRLSAVTHGIWWGLDWAFDLDSIERTRLGRTNVSFGTETAKVAIPAVAILRAVRAAASARFTLTGWNEAPDWQAVSREAEAHERILLEAIRQGAGDGD